MILVTGGFGFIGSNLVNALCDMGQKVAICDFDKVLNKAYFSNFNKIKILISPYKIESFIRSNKIELIYHLGAISSTTYTDGNMAWLNNVYFTLKIWKICIEKNIKIIYASSAATYGDGSLGFVDSNEITKMIKLKPLNLYGWTKLQVDLRVMFLVNTIKQLPLQWVGLKFFNVYGNNEFHKEDMKSVILKTYYQIKRNEQTKLFKSHNTNYKDGEQKRDFIYVKDCVRVLIWFLKNPSKSGIFNVGTGTSRSFIDLVTSVYKEMNRNINLKFINMPEEIKNKYQYETIADMKNLKSIGYNEKFLSLEEGIKDYIEILERN